MLSVAKFIKQDRAPLEPVGGKPFGVPELVLYFVESDGRFNTSGPGIRASLRIAESVERCKGKPWLKIEQDNDFELLRGAADTPAPQPFPNGAPRPAYPVSPAAKILPFLDDILKPMDDEPEVADPKSS